jgi:hypothetical protein
MLVFIAVGGNEKGAVRRAIDSDFALGTAANGTDLFALRGAETSGFALVADRAGHGFSSERQDNSAEYAVEQQKTKSGGRT